VFPPFDLLVLDDRLAGSVLADLSAELYPPAIGFSNHWCGWCGAGKSPFASLLRHSSAGCLPVLDVVVKEEESAGIKQGLSLVL